MPKLHELLATEGSLKGQANTARADLQNTFEKKKHHFTKTITTFQPLAEGQKEVTEAQLDLQSTIHQEISWLRPYLTQAIDAGYQVAIANTAAKADIVMEDGTTIAENVPATSLLELEKRLKEVQEFITSIPTLDPAKGFRPDPAEGEGVYVARDINKIRTQKMKKVYQLAPASDKHPAQVQLIDEDVPVGTIRLQEWSGLISVSDKAKYLERVEELTRAVKRARSRANDIDTDTLKTRIGAKLLNYVFGE